MEETNILYVGIGCLTLPLGDPLPIQVQFHWLEKWDLEHEHIIWPLWQVRMMITQDKPFHIGGGKENKSKLNSAPFQ